MRVCIIVAFIMSIIFGCSEDYSNLPQISVNYFWPTKQKCFDQRSPKIIIEKVPTGCKSLEINMYDLDSRYDHGGGTVDYEGSTIIPQGALKKYKGPCPNYGSPRYQLSIKVIDEKGTVIAFGKRTKKYPPESE